MFSYSLTAFLMMFYDRKRPHQSHILKKKNTSRVTIKMGNLLHSSAVVAEWLRRWTRNPLGSARTGSNPVGSDDFYLIFRLGLWQR